MIRDLLVTAIIILGLPIQGFGLSLWDHPANAGLKARIARAKLDVPLRAKNRATVARKVIILRPVSVVGHKVPRTDIYTLVEQEAIRVGIAPVALLAIEVHESAHYSSKLWVDGWNPGGIEVRKFEGIACWPNPRRRRFAAFASPEDGIKAHAQVLANCRYNGARQTSDPYAQIAAIGRAGYCEPGYNWTAQVKAHIRRLLKRGNEFFNRQYASVPTSVSAN